MIKAFQYIGKLRMKNSEYRMEKEEKAGVSPQLLIRKILDSELP